MLVALALALGAFPDLQSSQAWSVNLNNTLVWDRQPYMPIGVRVQGDAESVSKALDAGIKDLIVELPSNGTGWDEAAALIDAAGARWFLAVSSTAPGAVGTVVEPGSYRFEREGPFRAQATIPGASSAFGLIADMRDASVRSYQNYLTPGGSLDAEVDTRTSTLQVLLLYPVIQDLTFPDLWEGFDRHRDQLLRSLASHELGRGFRGIVDPLGPLAKFPTPDTMFVPNSALFRIELESYLQQKYGSVNTCVRAWSIGAHDIKDWSQLSRLVPLWSTSKGVELLWDPVGERTYPSDRRASAAWTDIRQVVRETAHRRYARLIQSLEQTTNAPVIQTWQGWNGAYESAASGLAAVGCDLTVRDFNDVIEGACRPASTVLQSASPMALIATHIRLPSDARIDFASVVSELKALGARGWYFAVSDPDELRQIAALNDGSLVDAGDAEWKPKALFYPEGARNPAIPARVFGATWTLPAPAAGNRLDLGSLISGYYCSGKGGDYTVIWSKSDHVAVKLYLGDPKSARIESLDGSDVRVRVRKDSIELEVTQTPLVITGIRDVPVPDVSYEETVLYMSALLGNFAPSVDPGGDQQMVFAQNVQAFKRNPIGAYTTLRKQFETFIVRAAPYLWIEAERATKASIGDIENVPGSSGGACLVMNQRMMTSTACTSNYRFKTRSPGTHEFWVAAAGDSDLTSSLSLVVNGRTLVCAELPTEFYGYGFKWYRFGSADLRAETELNINFTPKASSKVLIDTIVVSPTAFTPTGGQKPIGFIAPPTNQP